MKKSEKMQFCSILVLNYNGKKHLEKCFNALRELNYPKNRYEVIMIDNASKDDSVKFARKRFPWVKILKLEKNYGFCEGNNIGIKEAKGKCIIFLNNDTEVDKNWLIELVKVAEDKKVGICGSKILDEKLGEIGEGKMIFGMAYQRAGNKTKECEWVSGCSMFTKKEVINKLGIFFDSNFFMYYEDVDVCWRTRKIGYKVMYVPTSIVRHVGSSPNKKMAYLHYRNNIWTLKKNAEFPLKQIYMFLIFFAVLLRCPRNYKMEALRQIINSNYL